MSPGMPGLFDNIDIIFAMMHKILTAAISHLSDAQAWMIVGDLEQARKEINVVKRMLLEFPDLELEVPTERLDAVCREEYKR